MTSSRHRMSGSRDALPPRRRHPRSMSHPRMVTPSVEFANQIQKSSGFGLLERAATRLFGREVAITRSTAIGPYRLVTMQGEGLRDRSWHPGDYVQLLFGGWQARAYTPFVWSRDGTVSILGYVHGDGIASSFLASVRSGDRCIVYGPRSGVDLASLPRPLLLFGDETSLGTACAALCTAEEVRGLTCVFEVDDVDAARAALDAMEIDGEVTLVRRGEGHSHLEIVRERFRGQSSLRGAFTGNAASIRWLYSALRRDGVAGKRITNTPYWAAGKRGLD